MDIDRNKQLKIIEETNQLIHSTESQRMLLRFQRGVVDLENNRFQILQNGEFVDKLGEYLYTLYQKDPVGSILKILEKIGYCACSADKELRERAIFVLSVFIEKVSQEQSNPEFLEAVSRLLVDWLQIETEYLAGFPFICLQLQKILQKMLGMGLWYQTENLIIVLSQIQKGIIQKNNLIRQTISKVHSCLAEEAFLKNLVDIYLDKKEDRRDIAQCLLLHFGSKAAAVLVQYLIDCKDKEKRFSLIEFIPTTGKVVLPVCDFCLKQNPPWYVIRNLIIIISRMEDPKLYEMVRPYLTHKDIRVQLQILNCITKLRGANMRERLIEALNFMNDELKQQVVVQLGNMGGKDVGDALCSLLEKRSEFATHVRDELVLTICTKIKFEPSERAINVVKELISERKQRYSEEDRILQAARDALVGMELKNTTKVKPDSFSSSPMPIAFNSDTFKVPVATEEEFDSLLRGEEVALEEELEITLEPSTDSKKEEKQVNVNTPRQPHKEDTIKEATKNLTDPNSAIHFTIWAKLYEGMTTEEFTAFHTALTHKTYKPNELIIGHGDLQAPLFFFDSGSINLVRNLAGEEVRLSAIGAGDLIGSDIFLTGEAWNLSLYANEAVSAHVFDLEHLLKMQVDFPHLAEKLFTFCSRHDVLQNLLRVLDDPETAGSESTRIQWKTRSGKSANDSIQQGTLFRKLKGGLCFSLPVKTDEKLNIPLEYQLSLTVRLSSGEVDSLPATVVGTMRTAAMPGEAIILARFLLPLPDSQYACENIETLE
ncbi:MAG: cyclic nucleotide-binding domain-containing protein [Desulforhopalus sp.]